MLTVLQVVHVLNAIILILIVLLQQGKGGGMGLAFGGSSSTVFGGAGAGNFLTKITAWGAVIFMATSLSLAYMSGRSSTSATRGVQPPAATQQEDNNAVTAPTGAADATQPSASPTTK